MSGVNRAQAITSPTYRINVQNVDVRGCNQKVLEEGSGHVPGFELSFGQFPLRLDAGGTSYEN